MARGHGRLVGKVVLISGVARGQGRVAAQLFAREGASVVGCDLDAAGATETELMVASDGGDIVVLGVDLTDREQVGVWVRAAVERHGRIDVLYNNAGTPRFGEVAVMSDEDWSFTLRNELDITWNACQLAWPHLANGGGSIVNIASISGLCGMREMPGSAHAATKGAIIALTRQLAAEGVAVGIRANSISPGVIDTPATAPIAALPGFGPLGAVISRTSTGKPGRAEDVVYAALYLASDEAAYVNGADIVVDGGATVIQ